MFYLNFNLLETACYLKDGSEIYEKLLRAEKMT